VTSAVEVAEVTCRFGAVSALDAMSLTVQAGRVMGIVGPNGAGKTTLLDVVAGLVRPTSGSVRVFGQDIAPHSMGIRARMGVVPQETALYEELDAVQNLAFSAALYAVKDSRRRIDEVLELVGLSARRHDRVGTLSGGMQRRLAIARALLHTPELLLLDEPTLGVDVEARHHIWNYIRGLRDRGHTIVLATNYLDEAEALCDDVAVVRGGKVLARDEPSKLVARAGRCLELECDLESARTALATFAKSVRVEIAGERVRVYFDDGTEPDDLVRHVMAETRIRGFRVRSPDLMEVLDAIARSAPHSEGVQTSSPSRVRTA
jgi:ABC-2 type transport system ATP-binding protein